MLPPFGIVRPLFDLGLGMPLPKVDEVGLVLVVQGRFLVLDLGVEEIFLGLRRLCFNGLCATNAETPADTDVAGMVRTSFVTGSNVFHRSPTILAISVKDFVPLNSSRMELLKPT